MVYNIYVSAKVGVVYSCSGSLFLSVSLYHCRQLASSAWWSSAAAASAASAAAAAAPSPAADSYFRRRRRRGRPPGSPAPRARYAPRLNRHARTAPRARPVCVCVCLCVS